MVMKIMAIIISVGILGGLVGMGILGMVKTLMGNDNKDKKVQ